MQGSVSDTGGAPRTETARRTTLEVVAAGPPPTDDVPTTSITLIRPPVIVLEKRLSFMGLGPLIGLAYVAAAARIAGHTVQVIDAPGEDLYRFEAIETPLRSARRYGLSLHDIVARIDPGARVVGISHMFLHEWPTIRELARMIKQARPDVTLILGGENSTGFHRWIFDQSTDVDAVVLGEGEATLVMLLDRIAAGEPYAGLPGVAAPTRTGDGPAEVRLAPRLRRLDEIARPAWDLFPMESYLATRSYFGVDRGRSIPVLATRGCPYTCTFCSSPQMWTTRYSVRSAKEIVDEIEELVERYGITNVDFADLTAFTKRKWTIELCDELAERHPGVSIQVPQGTRSEALDDEVLLKLKQAGVRNITFAPETGSARLLETFDKRVDLEKMLDRIAAAERVGIVASANTIIGHPDETWKDRMLTWRFLLRASIRGLSGAGVSIFYPYPGSKDFTDLYDDGHLVVDDAYCYNSFTTSLSRIDRGRSLYGLLQLMVMSSTAVGYLVRPSRFVHLVRTVLRGGDEHTFMEQAIRTKLSGPMRWGAPAAEESPTPASVSPTVVPRRHARCRDAQP